MKTLYSISVVFLLFLKSSATYSQAAIYPLQENVALQAHELEKFYDLAKENKVPIIFMGSEKNALYSFAQAMRIAMMMKDNAETGIGWLASLRPITLITEDLQQKYDAHLAALANLQAA